MQSCMVIVLLKRMKRSTAVVDQQLREASGSDGELNYPKQLSESDF